MSLLPTDILVEIFSWEPELSYNVNKHLFELVCKQCNNSQLFSLLCLSLDCSVYLKIVCKYLKEINSLQRKFLQRKASYQGNPTTIAYLIDKFNWNPENFLPFLSDVIQRGKFANALFLATSLKPCDLEPLEFPEESGSYPNHYLPSDLVAYSKFLSYYLRRVNPYYANYILKYLESSINVEQVEVILICLESISGHKQITNIENIFHICYRLNRIDLFDRFIPIFDKSAAKTYFEDNKGSHIIDWVAKNQSIDTFEYIKGLMYLNNSFSYEYILNLCIQYDLIKLASHICGYNYISEAECEDVVKDYKNTDINNSTYLYLLEFTHGDISSAANEGYLQAIMELYRLETKPSKILKVLIHNMREEVTGVTEYILNNMPVIEDVNKFLNEILDATLFSGDTFKYVMEKLSIPTSKLESVLLKRLTKKIPTRTTNIRMLIELVVSRSDYNINLLLSNERVCNFYSHYM